MKAVVVEQAGTPDVLQLKQYPLPEPKSGWVRIQVKAFGLNRGEVFTRQGFSPSVKFPRILGIEAVGVVDNAPNDEFRIGQIVATVTGGMGRTFDGSYAEYVCVPARQVMALTTGLDWATLGAVPEMYLTAWAALTSNLKIKAGQILLVRGGTSAVGMASIALAKAEGLTVLATTRNEEKTQLLLKQGADHVIVDNGKTAPKVRELYPDGVDAVQELVGVTTIKDSLAATRRGGIVCVTGILGGKWKIPNFDPMADIPAGVYLTSANSEALDYREAEQALQRFITQVENGEQTVTINRIFGIDEIVAAHTYMEKNEGAGKIIVLV